jgi:peptidoglycan hydrolase-like protein with peptidoglycan-binding domain
MDAFKKFLSIRNYNKSAGDGKANPRKMRIRVASGLAASLLTAGAGIVAAAPQASAAVHYPQLGDKGQVVRCVQMGLAYEAMPVHFNKVIDGTFGINTKYDVEEFQGQNGLTVDGVVGPDTGTELLNIIGQHWSQAVYNSCSELLPQWI